MPELLATQDIPFQTEGRLLQELGLRLVASPQVALVELIKNAYDADSPDCCVRLEDDEQLLVVEDHGVGMTLQDFETKWMRIATSGKAKRDRSPKFKRKLTGAKGIGRFAVRFLGDGLHLTSIANDRARGFLTRLDADFDWPKLDRVANISDAVVRCTVTKAPKGSSTGTILRIRALRQAIDFTSDMRLRSDVLQIVTPLHGLERGRFGSENSPQGNDPGFTVVLPGKADGTALDLADLVLGNYWGRLTVDLSGNKLKLSVELNGIPKARELSIAFGNNISNGLFADIRYFPRRKGVFYQKGIDGRNAWSWVRANCGIKVVDHGFHIHPYGFEKDDWLQLDLDTSHNERQWRSDIAKKHFPIPPEFQKDPGENPALNLASNFQVVGAVFVETRRDVGNSDVVDLVPAMDREGVLENQAFAELRECIRAGVEFLAHVDKLQLRKRAEAEAKRAAATAREEIQFAIEHIQESPTLTTADKSRIIKQYTALADRVEEQEAYSAQARKSMMTMGLLGVVAGFMTHESKAIVHDLEMALETLSRLAKKDRSLQPDVQQLKSRLVAFRGYLDYSRLYIQSARGLREESLAVGSQIRRILDRFGSFAKDRGIKVSVDVDDSVRTPPLPVTAFSGVLLNLYTNAVKAILAAESK